MASCAGFIDNGRKDRAADESRVFGERGGNVSNPSWIDGRAICNSAVKVACCFCNGDFFWNTPSRNVMRKAWGVGG